ncbi:MAG: sigma-70 family RNA polymerase sigma factor [Planctomycetaceae bacterium]|nr:sigma-70 family RNA polymerase sigma factor [Planctomycetaceae bacterium]
MAHFFRHEYGRLVALLSCRMGLEHLEDVEDAVQSALMSALEHWTVSGVPDNPSAWLFRTARNRVLDSFRQQGRHERHLRSLAEISAHNKADRQTLLPEDAEEGLLRMLFACCDEQIPAPSQLVFALKTLCGFDVREIAIRLFTTQDNVYKRLNRARSRLRQLSQPLADLTADETTARRPAVTKILYLLFTEGYLSSHTEFPLRRELCDEAIRLTRLLASHSAGQSPQTFALLALMLLHRARMSAREDGSEGLLLLEEQDRTQWNRADIEEGLAWLERSASGDTFSRYHAEAGIAAEHCIAATFEQTRWDRVIECYELLEHSNASPLHRLNRAVAVAEWQDPAHGLALLEGMEPPAWLAGSYQWAAVLADLHGRCGHNTEARRYRETALRLAPSPHVRQLLQRRLQADGTQHREPE